MSTPSTIQLGLCMMYPSPGAIERIGPDWDWIWLDGQHGQVTNQDILLNMIRACQSVQRPAYVRVPGHEASWIGLALDAGADGVIVPQVDSVEQAQAAVKAAKFPPLGNRSYGGRRPIDLRGRGYFRQAPPLLICQIESPEAVEAAEDIAALPGVDGLFIGPDDLLLRHGVQVDESGDDAILGAATARAAAACRPHGKILVCVGANKTSFDLAVSNGATHIWAGGDVSFLVQGSKNAVMWAREALTLSTLPAGGASDTKLY